MEGAEGNIYAKESIFLGKKSYLDVLACDGNAVGGQHIRMKGIPSKVLANDTYKTYQSLFNGNEEDFDIVEFCNIDINTKTQRVTKRLKFSRKVKFEGEGIVVNKNEMSDEEYKQL
ncbi:hypothetical protein DYB25_001080 [Aphanomyces astaci]|nr:hypothetical protein DYB25_001080 [Aphanomyces astaci]